MNDIIARLLAAWNEHEDAEARKAAVAEILNGDLGEGVSLEQVRDAVVNHFDELHAKETYADTDITAMAVLVAASDVIEANLEAAAAREAEINGMAERIAAVKERAAQAPADAPEDAGASSEAEGEQDSTGGEIVAQETAESVSDVVEGGEAAAEAAEEEPVAVAASASNTARVPLGGHDKVATSAALERRTSYSTVAAAEVPGFSAGQSLPDMETLTAAAIERLQVFAGGGASGSQRFGIASIKKKGPFVAEDYDGKAVYDLIERATNERTLPEGNLVAAGGWCAPSETLYDMCPIADASAGMWDVPEITARRGGIRFPNVPDFSDIYSAVGFHLTETQVAAGTKKSCYEIPCTDYSECRMDVDGLCIKSPILTERAWPELVRYFTQQALAAHAHKLNAFKLATAAAAATAVVVSAPDPATDPAAYGPGATATLLGLIELQVEYYRYKYRMSQSATLEAVFPHWVLGILRSDLAKRNGVDLINVSDATLKAYLSARGVRAQFVYDWQDALATGTDTDFGGKANPKTWPATVDVLLYPAGTYFALTSDVITINGLYDSALLETNMHLALFTEEGIAVCKRCYQATKLTIPLCANGQTGSQVDIACPAA